MSSHHIISKYADHVELRFGRNTKARIYVVGSEQDYLLKIVDDAYRQAEQASPTKFRMVDIADGVQSGRIQDLDAAQVRRLNITSRPDTPAGVEMSTAEALLKRAEEKEAAVKRAERVKRGLGYADRLRERAAAEMTQADAEAADIAFRKSPDFTRRQAQAVQNVLDTFWSPTAPRSVFEGHLLRLRTLERGDIEGYDSLLVEFKAGERERLKNESAELAQRQQALRQEYATYADAPETAPDRDHSDLDREYVARLSAIEREFNDRKAAAQMERQQRQSEHEAKFPPSLLGP